MKKYYLVGALAIASCVYITSCKPKQAVTSQVTCTTTPTYTAEIKSILDVNCASSCHSAEHHAHSIDLSTYETAKEVASHNSFMGAINHESGYAPMPAKHPKLDNATIEKLSCWTKNGMPK